MVADWVYLVFLCICWLVVKLSKPIAIVTGSGSGIGKGLLSSLKENYEVIGVTRSGYSSKYLIFQCDVGKEKDVASLFKGLSSMLDQRGVKLLVNCAGVNRIGYLENLSVEDWDECYSSNVRSVFLMSQYCLPFLSKVGGSICNIGSIAGRQPMRATLPYCSSKAALTMMTKQMARELYDRHNVSVFELAVGYRVVGTKLTDYSRKKVCEVRGWTETEYDIHDSGMKIGMEDLIRVIMMWLGDPDRLQDFNGNIVEIGE